MENQEEERKKKIEEEIHGLRENLSVIRDQIDQALDTCNRLFHLVSEG